MTQQLAPGRGAGADASASAADAQDSLATRRYAGWRDAAVRMVREEGAASLLRGIRTRVIMLSLGGACFLGTYEEATRLLSRLLREEEGCE